MGIDLGGSGFRIGVFDTSTGALLHPLRHYNHSASTDPADVLPALVSAIEDLGWTGPIGLGFPGAVGASRPTTAPNLGAAWVGKDVGAALNQFHGGAFAMLNDADAVAVAEAEHGVGHDEHHCVLTLTVGTGLGTTVHRQGTMIPNLEYGRLPHPRLEGCLEEHLSGAARTRQGWDLKTWASHFQEGLTYLEEMVQPERIVLYGGIMEHWSSIQPLLRTEAELVAAVLTETAGPLGAALSAACAAQPL